MKRDLKMRITWLLSISFIGFFVGLTNQAYAQEISVQRPSGGLVSTGGTANLGVHSSQTDFTFTITNSQSLSTLSLTGSPDPVQLVSGAPDFVVFAQPTNTNLLVGFSGSTSTTFTVRFTPSTNGVRTGLLSISNNDSNENPYIINLTAIADGGEIEVLGNSTRDIADGSTTTNISNHTDFTSVDTFGNNSISRNFIIRNLIEENLTISSVVSSNSEFAITTSPSTTVTTTTFIGTTTLGITFNPTTAGIRTSTITIENTDDDEDPFTFAVSGVGLEAELDLLANSSPTVSGGNINLGDIGTYSEVVDVTLEIQNNGDTPLQLTGSPAVMSNMIGNSMFSIPSQPATTVPASGSVSFVVRADPSTTGIGQIDLTIASNDLDENPYTFSIFATGVLEGAVEVEANSVTIANGDTTPDAGDHTDFGQAAIVNDTISRTFTINNIGDGDLNLTGIPLVNITGAAAANFSVSSLPSALIAMGGATTFDVSFTPSIAGTRDATIEIASDDPNDSPFTFSIRGEGILAPEIGLSGNSQPITSGDVTPVVGDGTDFGNVDILGGTSQSTFTVANTGSATLNLTGSPNTVEVTGTDAAEFSVTSLPSATVSVAGNTAFSITFDPTTVGTKNATVSIANDDSDESPYTFDITGEAIVLPEIRLSGLSQEIFNADTTPDSADGTDFGAQAVGGAPFARTFTIENPGSGDLSVALPVTLSGAGSGDYSITQQPSATIASMGSSDLIISFSPTIPGGRDATVSIVSDDSDENPFTFSLTGLGVSPEIDIQGNSISIVSGDTIPDPGDSTDFGSIPSLGANVLNTFVIINTGTEALQLPNDPRVEITGTNAADFSVVAVPPSSIPAGSTGVFTISFDPSSAGSKQATVSVVNSDLDEATYTFAITGTGTPTPEIDIRGTDTLIPSGDTTPSTADGTDFGDLDIDAPAVSRTFEIHNIGSDPLTLSGSPLVEITGANAGEFSLMIAPSSLVNAAASTSFTIDFDPTSVGMKSATLTVVSDDADESSYSFAIAGNATAEPEIAVSGNSNNIAAGDSTPDAADGTDFGQVVVASGNSSSTFEIANTGSDVLMLTGATVAELSGPAAADFSLILPMLGGLSPASNLSFDVEFDPSQPGLREATVTIQNSDSDEGLFTFSISGEGLAPDLDVYGDGTEILVGDSTPSISKNTDFGTVEVEGGSATQILLLNNSGNHPLTLSGPVTITGAAAADFSVGLQPDVVIAPGGFSVLVVNFDPSAAGARAAEIVISSDDFISPSFNFAIIGTGDPDMPPVLSAIETATLEFAEGTPPTPITSTVVVEDSDTPLLVSARVAIATGYVAGEDLLNFTNQNGIFGSFDATSGVLDLSGLATLANYQLALRSVSYQNTSSEPNTDIRTVEISVQGEIAGSNTVTRDISVLDDSDNDGQPDSADTDDDNDGLTDIEEQNLGTNAKLADSDGDGVDDGRESKDGSNPLDGGSSNIYTGKQVCVNWNGFVIFLTQIIELQNNGDGPVSVDVTLYDIDGDAHETIAHQLDPGIQRDIILNDMDGFEADTLGIVCAEITSGAEDSLSGRLVTYKFGDSSYSLAYRTDFLLPRMGAQYVTYNTFQPSLRGADVGNFVANWIQLVNRGSEKDGGTLRYYDSEGGELTELDLDFEPGERKDFDVHSVGQVKVGLVEWIPDSADSNFSVWQNRYYYGVGGLVDLVDVVSLSAKQGNGEKLLAPFDTQNKTGAVEISNTTSSDITLAVVIRDAAGNIVEGGEINLPIPAYGTRSLVLNGYLESGLGSIAVDAPVIESVVGQIIEYGRASDGALEYASPTPLNEVTSSEYSGTYNSFLAQGCRLRVVNDDTSEITSTVSMLRWDGTSILSNLELPVPASGVSELELCTFETEQAYGEVRVSSGSSAKIGGHVVRQNTEGDVEFGG